MFYYAHIGVSVIDEAEEAGRMGLGRLRDVVMGFCKDTFLVETDLWRASETLGERVRKIADQNERKSLQDALTRLRRKGPEVIVNGDDGECCLDSFLAENAASCEIDLLLTTAIDTRESGNLSISSLARLDESHFDQNRNNKTGGVKFNAGTKTFEEVAEACFRKLIRHSNHVTVYDYALGKFYNNDQPANLKKLVRYLGDNSILLKTLEIKTVDDPPISLRKDIENLQHEVDFTIQLSTSPEKQLPHRRFLGADGRFLDIDRGIDLCDSNGMNRPTTIIYCDPPS